MPSAHICNMRFTYDFKDRTDIEKNHWIDTYFNVTLSTKEHVGQISVQYDFTPAPESHHKPAISVYFEQDGEQVGAIQNLAQDTITALETDKRRRRVSAGFAEDDE